MKFLGKVLVGTVVAGLAVYAAAMVVDSMEVERFWHSVEPRGDG